MLNRVTPADLPTAVADILARTPFIDMHTHLFAPRFGALGLWGIDELLTYHYLEAELFRFRTVRPEGYWSLTKSQQADLIWKTLFVDNTPISEAARGVIAVLDAFGLPTDSADLEATREFFRNQNYAEHLANVFRLAGIDRMVMTNDPLDETERTLWLDDGRAPDPRFGAALRLDRMVNEWETHVPSLRKLGFAVQSDAGASTVSELRRFLDEWTERMAPLYMAVSLPDTFAFPAPDIRTELLREAVLPACRDHDLSLALMIGVRRGANPKLRAAGDASGRADLQAIASLCRDFPDNRFLVTVLSRENQHELCVAARKFGNLMPFGCWWFLNNPSVVEEITRERIELLGVSFIPQHSDARVLEQLIYKWKNTRRTLAPILTRSYALLLEDGGAVSRELISRDVQQLFRWNFERFTHASPARENSLSST